MVSSFSARARQGQLKAIATFLPFSIPIHVDFHREVNDLYELSPGQLASSSGSDIFWIAGNP